METELTEPVASPSNGQVPEEWKVDKKGKEYVARGGGKPGTIPRQDGETVEQARERDATPKEERRPRRKAPAKPKLPPGPRKVDLRELEHALAEGLKAPGIVCASFGDAWAANHFTNAGPYLARNLILAAEHNPWLRSKLEQAATGEDAMMRIVGIMGIGGAVVMYTAPPIIYFLNLRVPDKARDMLDVPPRREPERAAPEAHPAGHPAFAA